MTEHQRYQQTLDYLYQQLPMFQRVGPVAFKKDLSNIVALAEMLDQPQERFPSIHIAGTNGKGSVAHMLSAILQAHGYKTGLYTSPHYHDFRERIKIDGQWVEKAYIVDFVDRYKDTFSTIKPSYFEITVAMAFDYFAKKEVDIAVIETGLGGRLDSTNIIHPLVSVITNISYDHMNFLGNTLPAIAGEKAGIIKRRVPVVIGETHPETESVFYQKAREMESPIYFADQQYQAQLRGITIEHSHFDVLQGGKVVFEDLEVNLLGAYQSRNLVTVLQTIEILQQLGYELNKDGLRKGLKQLRDLSHFMGRWQVLGRHPLVVADSGHNEAGIREVTAQLKAQPFRQLHMVLVR